MKEQRRNKEFDKKIIECIQLGYSFFAWQSLGGVIEKCELRAKAFRADYGEIEIEVKEGQEHFLSKVVGGKRKISIYIPEMAIAFEAVIKNISDGKRIKLDIPENFSVHERRKHERVLPIQKTYVSLEINKKVYKKTIYDISLGGFSIVLPKIERLGIVKDTMISSVILELGGHKIVAKAQCTSAFQFDRFKFDNLPYGGQKLSFCFKEMSLEDKTQMQEFIVAELLTSHLKKKVN